VQLSIDPDKSLIYLDPPYYEKGPTLYRSYFNREDHTKLMKFLKGELNVRWILSYDDVPAIRELYKDTKKNGFLVNHFAYKAKVGKELIISSDNCVLPKYKISETYE